MKPACLTVAGGGQAGFNSFFANSLPRTKTKTSNMLTANCEALRGTVVNRSFSIGTYITAKSDEIWERIAECRKQIFSNLKSQIVTSSFQETLVSNDRAFSIRAEHHMNSFHISLDTIYCTIYTSGSLARGLGAKNRR